MLFVESRQVNGTAIHYELVGSHDPTLLLIHGLGSDPGQLQGCVNQFRGTWRVLVPILRGHAPSGTSPPFTTEQLADDLLRLTTELSLGKLVAIGFSRGAQVALALASSVPERVAGVISVGGTTRTPPAHLEGAASLFETIRNPGGLERFAEFFASRVHSKASAAANSSLRAYAKLQMVRHGPEVMIQLIRDSYASDIRALLPSVQCPVSLVVGADDQIADLSAQVELRSGLPHAKVRVLPDVGHDYIGEAQGQINAIIAEFLIELAAQPASAST